jgi:hypothetical protein
VCSRNVATFRTNLMPLAAFYSWKWMRQILAKGEKIFTSITTRRYIPPPPPKVTFAIAFLNASSNVLHCCIVYTLIHFKNNPLLISYPTGCNVRFVLSQIPKPFCGGWGWGGKWRDVTAFPQAGRCHALVHTTGRMWSWILIYIIASEFDSRLPAM